MTIREPDFMLHERSAQTYLSMLMFFLLLVGSLGFSNTRAILVIDGEVVGGKAFIATVPPAPAPFANGVKNVIKNIVSDLGLGAPQRRDGANVQQRRGVPITGPGTGPFAVVPVSNSGSTVQQLVGGTDLAVGREGGGTSGSSGFQGGPAALTSNSGGQPGLSQPLSESAPLPVSAVPEPATWAMMISGFLLIGAALRRARRESASPAGAM